MSIPIVSVVIPTSNRAAFLREAIASVLVQTFSDFELIVVDDGSTDDTPTLFDTVHDGRVRFLRQDNSGVASARNRGAALARGTYLAFLDSDDLWEPRKLEVQLAFHREMSRSVLSQTEEMWVRRGRRVNPRQKHTKRSGWIFEHCLPLCIVSPSAVMMEREIFDELGGFDERFPACEDYDLWLRAALRYEIHTLPEPLIVKRGGHGDQLSAAWGLDRYRIQALQKCLRDPLLTDDLRPLVEEQIIHRARIVAEGARKRGNEELYREYAVCAEMVSRS